MSFPWSRLLACTPALVVMGAGEALAAVYSNQEQALALAFPVSTDVQRKSLFLDERRVKEIEQAAKANLPSKLVTYYVGVKDGETLGYAFFSTHIVRTMPETIMTVVNPDGTVRMVELLAFQEPEDYRPSKRWLSLFSRQKLDNDLRVKRGIRNITGATITAQAITDSVRVTLAIHDKAIKDNSK